jgi:hypothetical protein
MKSHSVSAPMGDRHRVFFIGSPADLGVTHR